MLIGREYKNRKLKEFDNYNNNSSMLSSEEPQKIDQCKSFFFHAHRILEMLLMSHDR